MRTILVSNRLPITLARGPDGVRVHRSSGGLASALSASRETSLWIGWAGSTTGFEGAEYAAVRARFDELGVVPVPLNAEEVAGYYEGFSNGVLWPLFHYLPSQLPLRIEGWSDYRDVNAKFADVVARQYQPGDHIWVHDYQLLLLPAMLRERLPQARIGFFLHIPFPDAELFAVLPHREDLLRGMLGADLIGFHTHRYLLHFQSAVRRVLHLEHQRDDVMLGARRVRVGVYPVGVDAAALQRRAERSDVGREVMRLRRDASTSLVVGVDRLDYTKGIPRRLLAFEHLLERDPRWHGRVRLVQIAVPSRDAVGAYRRFRREVTTIVGEINGRFGTPHWTPVHYVHRSVPQSQLLALYRAADVMFVTPIRDGMNLVAKEFVAARSDEDGVLILSEFAGAAAELDAAVIVNPFDVEQTAEQLKQALELPREERRSRMRRLRQVVFGYDVNRWTNEFLSALAG